MPGNRGKNTFPRSTNTTSSSTIGGTLKESSSLDLSPNHTDRGHAASNTGSAVRTCVRLVKPGDMDVDKRMDKATPARGAGTKEGTLSDWADLRNRYGRKCTFDNISVIYGQDEEGGGVLSLFKAYCRYTLGNRPSYAANYELETTRHSAA